jgi:Cytochrome C oxidase, cbb3-type, subunit III
MKKHIMLAVIAFFTIGVMVISCSKKSEDTVTPPPPTDDSSGNASCDTTNSKYATDVVPILQSNCYSCHGTSTNAGSGGIILQDFSVISNYADNGTLIGVITHATGYPAMPKSGGKLSDCDINTIRSWIENGIQNN